MVNVDYFSNANANASANANANAKVLLNLFLQQKIMNNHENLQKNIKMLTFLNRIAATNHHPTFFFLVGWVGAVPHPLPGVPLTFLSAFHIEIQGKC